MSVCPKCGWRDIPQWQHSRFDYNADYMRFDEAMAISDLKEITDFLKDKGNFVPFVVDPYTFYRRGKGGKWLYRVPNEDFRVDVEKRKPFLKGKQLKLTKKLLVVSEKHE